MDHSCTDDVRQALEDYKNAVASAPDAGAAFRIAEQAAARLIGHQLFTIMAFHAETMEVERCHSSNPDKYPTGGRKQKRDTAWGHHVLEQGQHYIGYNADDIRRSFDDHAVIQDLGLESVLNIPIEENGRAVGTMNLLDKAGYYHEGQVDIARVIANTLAGVLQNRSSQRR
ncbi:MAG: GAF domain-containing protein [Rhodospirillales bacterium]